VNNFYPKICFEFELGKQLLQTGAQALLEKYCAQSMVAQDMVLPFSSRESGIEWNHIVFANLFPGLLQEKCTLYTAAYCSNAKMQYFVTTTLLQLIISFHLFHIIVKKLQTILL
jgi:hypothetical protein